MILPIDLKFGILLYFNKTDTPNFGERTIEFLLKHAKCAKCELEIDVKSYTCSCSSRKGFYVPHECEPELRTILKYEALRSYSKVSAVIRADRIRKAKKGVVKNLSWHLELQDNLCYYCMKFLNKSDPINLDHRHPIAKGGIHSSRNLVATCKPCNSKKAGKSERQYWNQLKSELDHTVFCEINARAKLIRERIIKELKQIKNSRSQ